MATPASARMVNGGKSFVASASRFWQRSYASDYVGLMILLAAYMLMHFFMEPFHRMFFLDNINIQYPHALVERVPVSWLFIYAGAAPLGCLILWLLVAGSAVHKAHVTLLGLFISLILTSFTTDVIKNAVGRPRPDLIARCKPEKGTPAHQLVTWEVCTETNHHTLHDGWRSFPSGHSSFAFAGLGYISLFLMGQMHVFRPRADLARVLLAFAPVLGAALIAISRCEDYRHDVYDVTTGSIIGFLTARFSYRRYYPPLCSRQCEVPFPPPELNVNGRARDDVESFAVVGDYEIAQDDDEEVELNNLLPSVARGNGRVQHAD